MAIRDCQRLTPRSYAPCVALGLGLANGTYAEELVYPDFSIPIPAFLNNEHKDVWLQGAHRGLDRATYQDRDGERLLYRGQHGQNFVFHNVEFKQEMNIDAWGGEGCMERAAKLQRVEPIHPAPAPQTAVIVVNTPDSWSFQHFLDRASHVITQAAHLSYNKPTPKVLTGRRPSGPVSALWDRMGYSDRVHETRTQTHAIQAASLIWPCRSVLIHPYLSWRIAEMMRMPWALNTSFNSSKKKTVMYMSRSAHTLNGGRNVVNEKEVIEAITAALEQRGQGETIELFDQDKYSDPQAAIDHFSNNVLAVVGPHGGALMNHRFAGPGTLVLEFLPTSRLEWLNFEEASLLKQTYATIIVDPVAGNTGDMVVNPDDVVEMLARHLGVASKETVAQIYPWDV